METAHNYIPSVELAARYGLTNDHVASLCRKGALRAERMGKLWMVDETTLKSYLARMRREREERHRALSARFKQELTARMPQTSLQRSSARFSTDSFEWAFAVVLVVAFSTGLARAAEAPALAPVGSSASVV